MTRSINKKTLRPLIKKESLERMSLSIAKKRMFPQSKSKQRLLSNLEKIKKFKPLIKQSMDVYEKPRKSLNRARFELAEADRGGGESPAKAEVITEEDASNYNTRNSYDDFMEIEKNIRKSIQIDNLRGLVGGKTKSGKKRRVKKTKPKNEEKYVGKGPGNRRRNRGADDRTAQEGRAQARPEAGQARPTRAAEAAAQNAQADHDGGGPLGGGLGGEPAETERGNGARERGFE